MNLTLTSLHGEIREIPEILSVSIPTKEGMIQILPGHEPLVCALGSGILSITDAHKSHRFAMHGGVLETDGTTIRIVTEMAEDEITDLSMIQKRKEEAHKAMEEIRSSGDVISMERLIEIEQEYQRDTAREQLAMENSHRV